MPVVRRGKYFSLLLEGKQPFYIHSVFDRAINLVSDGAFLALLPQERGGGEGYATIAISRGISFTGLGLFPGYQVEAEDGYRVRLAPKVLVDFSLSLPWESPLKGIKAPLYIKEENLRLLQAALEGSTVPSPFKLVLAGSKNELILLIHKLRTSLLLQDPEGLEEALKGLIGWGPGLTPSGDDLILGLSLTRTIWRKAYGLQEGIWEKRVTSLLGRTLPLSAFFLKEALQGRGHEFIEKVLACVLGKTPREMGEAVEELLGVGGSSGFDMALGVYLSLEWQRRDNWCLNG
ncbi:DUF2877 domain-containing protein [Thermanaeromonas toyohensis]|uniref:DUF2877 domain-containing protein n=1 Tax=Thermanaeromonas toyohensis TaxID=161154 RepID=UPI001560853B|nr:DUF2877 domain-containing protein [Thermanaeromonas toyohensis]